MINWSVAFGYSDLILDVPKHQISGVYWNRYFEVIPVREVVFRKDGKIRGIVKLLAPMTNWSVGLGNLVWILNVPKHQISGMYRILYFEVIPVGKDVIRNERFAAMLNCGLQ